MFDSGVGKMPAARIGGKGLPSKISLPLRQRKRGDSMAQLLSFRHREPRPILRINDCLMRARTAALRLSPPQVYQEMISFPMEKRGVASIWPWLNPLILEFGLVIFWYIGIFTGFPQPLPLP